MQSAVRIIEEAHIAYADDCRGLHLLLAAKVDEMLPPDIGIVAAGAAIGDDYISDGGVFVANPARHAAGHAEFDIIMVGGGHNDVIRFIPPWDRLQFVVINSHVLSSSWSLH